MAPRGFAIFVGEMPMFGVVAVFAMRWVVLLVILWWWLETYGVAKGYMGIAPTARRGWWASGSLSGCFAALWSAYIVNMEGKIRRKEYKTLYSDKGSSRGYKKEMVVSRQPTLINLKSNTMKNTLQM